MTESQKNQFLYSLLDAIMFIEDMTFNTEHDATEGLKELHKYIYNTKTKENGK